MLGLQSCYSTLQTTFCTVENIQFVKPKHSKKLCDQQPLQTAEAVTATPAADTATSAATKSFDVSSLDHFLDGLATVNPSAFVLSNILTGLYQRAVHRSCHCAYHPCQIP